MFAALLSACIILQSLVFVQLGNAHTTLAAPAGAYETIVICSGGVIREIHIDADGHIIEIDNEAGEGVHCPLCIVGAVASLAASATDVVWFPVISDFVFYDSYTLPLITLRKPDQVNCLDPPAYA